LRARSCPICDGENDGRWTCPRCTPVVNVHRELIRNLQSWHSLYEALEVPDILVASDGRSYSIWDIDLFYGQRSCLPHQMGRAIELCLYNNVLERNAAVLMGVAPSNPVAVYATVGLTRLLSQAYTGDLPGYRLLVEAVA
jgi:hypothetical protein